MNTKFYISVKRLLGHTFIGVIFVTVFGTAVMLLWNWLMPTLFELPTIDIWQALGLLILIRILFGSFHFLGGRYGFHKTGKFTPNQHKHFKDKWLNMSDQDKKDFIKNRRKHVHDFYHLWNPTNTHNDLDESVNNRNEN
jgi:hypothetical protein